MKNLSKILIMAAVFSAAGLAYAGQATEYQYGTITALMGGDYSVKASVSEVKKHNDFGLGAGVGIGEVIAVNGDFYLADPNGNASKMKKKDGLSYMTAINFNPKKSLSFRVDKEISITDLQKLILEKTANNQIMYAVKITGEFTSVLARSEDRDMDSQTPLVKWMKTHQHKFNLKNVEGTFVVFYTPKYIVGIGVPGFHTHYLSEDYKITGHVLNATVKSAKVEIEPIYNLNLRLGDVKSQEKEVTLDGLHQLENVIHQN
jgi:acetolactate decarboxylase